MKEEEQETKSPKVCPKKEKMQSKNIIIKAKV
jgi:hypothetical protein